MKFWYSTTYDTPRDLLKAHKEMLPYI